MMKTRQTASNRLAHHEKTEQTAPGSFKPGLCQPGRYISTATQVKTSNNNGFRRFSANFALIHLG